MASSLLPPERIGRPVMRPVIAGNWKRHGMAPQLAEIEAIAASVKAAPPLADVLICLPVTLIARAAETAAGWVDVGGKHCSVEVCPYHRGSWGPKEADAIITADGGWNNPTRYEEASGV
jgi:triosephosphate isomerase